jgi:RimJ/RimL family protein N-acetyltransferase
MQLLSLGANQPQRSELERAGFEREGVSRRNVRRKAGWEDELLYVKVAAERG